ncbi:serine/threonine-protein kinase [Nocardioides panaciterrulae]|uniref:non-specific serine/threonine protein kinase n=1 Tax=Nocardioides panaciterrulae TaxID=661492 RepID=A0A7Y9J9N2_9ACTN|nr:serine/threonine-protein kinase [Nocardioides panaciterrulae]NYD40780.1 serine/threonine protein kinase [Nocardioides panaciterrulae]
MAGFPKAGDEYGGRYRILRQIGHGGMGIVYEALDTVLNRSVALKIVLPSLPDREDYQARFAREANVLARIRSRNIVGIHEYGEHEDTVFFVTEYFPDGDLQTWIGTHGPLERRVALALVAQVCEALADAHAAGVIHRDVKPGNVLLWSRPEGLIPYLCDFGIALDGGSDGRGSLTRTGTLVGSPAYMAPERHFGHAADERGDIYSVGCLLWAILTGDAPYSGTDFQMMNSHINSPVPQLATGHPVDDRIDEVLAEAMNKDPERRTPSASALRSSLLAVVRELDAAAAPPHSSPAGAVEPPVPIEPATDPAPVRHTVIRSLSASADVLPTGEQPAGSGPGGSGPGGSGPGGSGPDGTEPDGTAVPPHSWRPSSPPTHTQPRGRRRWLPATVLAAAAVVAVAVTAVAVGAGGGDDRAPAATPTRSSVGATGSPSPTSTPTETVETIRPLADPGPPRVHAHAGYRSVRFTIDPPRKQRHGIERTMQVDAGHGWRTARRVVSVPTREGGARACVRVRTLDVDGSLQQATSKPVRSCGTAQPRAVRFVRTADACTNGANCHWYDVYAVGFTPGTAPTAYVYNSAGQPWCDCTFHRIRIGKDGRGAQVHEWQVPEGYRTNVTLDIDGVRQTVYLP